MRLQGETERLQVPNLSSSQQRPAARQSPAGRAERAAAVCRLLACWPFGFSALNFGFARQLATTAFAAARSSAGQHSLVFAGGGTRAGGAAACRGERAQRAGSSAAASRLMAAGLVAAGFLGPPASPIIPLCLASARCRVASATTAHLKARRRRRCRPLVNSLSLPTLCAAGPRPPDRGRARGMSRRCEPSWSSWARTPLESQHPTGQRRSPVWKMRWTACCPTM